MLRVYYGTKNRSGSQGIYTGTLDPQTGQLSEPQLAAEAENPGFLAISLSGDFLYAVANGEKGQRIVSYTIDRESGKLDELNSQEVGGVNPCHLSIGPNDRFVVYANYTGGSCGMMPLADDGTLQPRSSFFQHSGSSEINPSRQEAPHPHSAMVHPDGHLVMVPDLGQDKIRIYRVTGDSPRMIPNETPVAEMPAGGGPRHVTFHPNRVWMYSNNELASSVSFLELDTTTGTTDLKQTISTLPSDFDGENLTAEILVHPSGSFLYCSNRGHDTIASFSIDPSDGSLTSTGHATSGGKTPRNFGITPNGDYLVSANQDSDDVITHTINPTTGRLTPTGHAIKVPHCICVRFLE